VDLAREYGQNFGMAFQILDDLLDYDLNHSGATGKDVGRDFRERCVTLPLVLLMKKATESEKEEVEAIFKESAPTEEHFEQVQKLMRRHNIEREVLTYAIPCVNRALSSMDGEWAGKMHNDLIDAVNHMVKKGISDPKKICIMGGSYGGYATLVGLTMTPDTFACGVCIVGMSNLITLYESFPPYWKPIIENFKIKIGGDPSTEAGKKVFEAKSPLFYVNNIKKPLIIAHGANDPRVKQAEADQIVAAMEKNNIPVTYALYPDEGHGFVRPENRISFYALTEKFLATYLGGRFEDHDDSLGSMKLKEVLAQ
jgi:dienelactone hydrolase